MTCLPQAGRGGGTRRQRDPSRERLSSDANPFGMNPAVPGFHAHARRLSVTCIYASAQQRPVDGTAPNSPRPPRKASALFSVPSRFVHAEAAGTQVLRGPTRRQVAQHRPAETELWVRTGKGPPAPAEGQRLSLTVCSSASVRGVNSAVLGRGAPCATNLVPRERAWCQRHGQRPRKGPAPPRSAAAAHRGAGRRAPRCPRKRPAWV